MANHSTTSRPAKRDVKCVCMHMDTRTHTHTHTHIRTAPLSVPYERSKHHRLSAIKQRMRERQQNKLIKRERVIQATERKEKHKAKRYKQEQRGEGQGRKRTKTFTYVPEWMRSLHPRAICTQRTMYVSGGQSDNISQEGCSFEPITASVSDIRCTVGFKPRNMIFWGNKKTLYKGGFSWKWNPYWIRL